MRHHYFERVPLITHGMTKAGQHAANCLRAAVGGNWKAAYDRGLGAYHCEGVFYDKSDYDRLVKHLKSCGAAFETERKGDDYIVKINLETPAKWADRHDLRAQEWQR